jgi:hypothetical protein
VSGFRETLHRPILSYEFVAGVAWLRVRSSPEVVAAMPRVSVSTGPVRCWLEVSSSAGTSTSRNRSPTVPIHPAKECSGVAARPHGEFLPNTCHRATTWVLGDRTFIEERERSPLPATFVA